jgi:hypothetical protein
MTFCFQIQQKDKQVILIQIIYKINPVNNLIIREKFYIKNFLKITNYRK